MHDTWQQALDTYLRNQTEIEREAYRKFRAGLTETEADHGGQEGDPDNEATGD